MIIVVGFIDEVTAIAYHVIKANISRLYSQWQGLALTG